MSKYQLTAVSCAVALGFAAIGRAAETPSYMTYDAGFSRWLNAPKTVEMSQGVTFNQGETTLKMDAAIVNLDDHQRALNAKSLAPIHLYDAKNDLTALHGAIDFTHRIATLTDNITVVVKPAAKGEKPKKSSLSASYTDPATITCQGITYDYKKKIGHVPGPLTVHQKDRVVTADSAEYEGNGQIVTLFGNVHGHDKDGNVIETTKLVMVIKEGAESITIPVPTHGQFRVKDEPEAPAEKPPEQKPAASPAKP